MTNPVPESNTPVTPSVSTPAEASTPAPLSDEAQRLHDYFKLIDPDQEGVGLDQVRPIYPKVGWNVILGHCAELEAAGKLTKVKKIPDSGRGGWEEYSWQ